MTIIFENRRPVKNPKEFFLLCRVLLVLTVIKVGLITLPFSVFRRFYTSFGTNQFRYTDYIIYCINGLAHRLPFGFTCLPKALTLKYFLSDDSNAKVIVGVQMEHQRLKAHAWVEKNGVVLIGDLTNEHFKPIWQWQ